MQPQDAASTPEASDFYDKNRQVFMQVLNVCDRPTEQPRKLTLAIERILVDRAHNTFVPYTGENGIEDFLVNFGKAWPEFHERWYNSHLMSLYGALGTRSGEAIRFEVSLSPGGQLVCKAGPTTSLGAMLEAFDAFDRQLHVVSHHMGCDYVLLSEGYNPLTRSPLDVALVPRTRWTLFNAHLGQTGRYARDAMRCECATHIGMDLGTAMMPALEYQTAVALMPLLTFLTDNVRCFRTADTQHTPRMLRSVIWNEVDKARCGVIPRTFDQDFDARAYLDWMEGIQPIVFVDDKGVTSSTGKQTLRDVMRQRELSKNEAMLMLDSVFPSVRIINSTMELLQADALRPHLAVAYLAFVKGLFASKFSVKATHTFLGHASTDSVEAAVNELRENGWKARIYGKRVSQVMQQLLQVAKTELDSSERRILDDIAEQWDVHMVPRDTFVHQALRSSRF